MKINLTTAYTPHSNGNAERQIRIINKILRVFLQGLGNTWDAILPHVQFEMNSAYVSSIGMPPARALLGFHPLTPMSVNVAHDRPHPTSLDFATLHNTYHQISRDGLRTAQLRIVQQLDQHSSLKQSYQVGYFAWLSSADVSIPGGSHFFFGFQSFNNKNKVERLGYRGNGSERWRVRSCAMPSVSRDPYISPPLLSRLTCRSALRAGTAAQLVFSPLLKPGSRPRST